MFDIKHTV